MEANFNTHHHRPGVKYVAMMNREFSKEEATFETDDLHEKTSQGGIGLTSRIGEVKNDGQNQSESNEVIPELNPDINIYQNKKTVAQGMMDLALFSANASQLRYVLDTNHAYFWPAVLMISASLIVQVAIGVGLLMNTQYNVKDKKEICVANKINNLTIVGIFLVTVINVFICAFGVVNAGVPVTAAPKSGGE